MKFIDNCRREVCIFSCVWDFSVLIRQRIANKSNNVVSKIVSLTLRYDDKKKRRVRYAETVEEKEKERGNGNSLS